jgi:hypothetical protein
MKNFVTNGKEELLELESAQRNPEDPPDDRYMEFDSEIDPNTEESGGANGSSPRGIHQA